MTKSIDVKFETDIVTGEAVAQFVTSILEFLLYQRNQIPFVCATFKYMVSKWNKTDDDIDVPENFNLERQKSLARQTMHDIKAMSEVIRKAFDERDVSCVRFLFGSMAVTPKEAYTIHIPHISRKHSYEHHKLKVALLNQALISLLTSDCLNNPLMANLGPTNVYLELEMPDYGTGDWDQVFPTDLCELPPSCKQFVINLVHTQPADYVETKCCKEMTIFQDIANLSLSGEGKEQESGNANASHRVGWWEASTIVRGLKQKNVKGFNLWQ